MPVESKAQFRFMQAVAHGDVPGTSPSVGKDFLQHTAKGAYKNLPEKKGKKNGRASSARRKKGT